VVFFFGRINSRWHRSKHVRYSLYRIELNYARWELRGGKWLRRFIGLVRRWLPRRWRAHRRTHARAPSGGAGGLSLCRVFLLPLVKRMNTMVRTLYRGHPLYGGHPGTPGSGLLCRLLTSNWFEASAGGRPAHVVFCPPGPPRRTAQLLVPNLQRTSCRICVARSLRDDTGKPESAGISGQGVAAR